MANAFFCAPSCLPSCLPFAIYFRTTWYQDPVNGSDAPPEALLQVCGRCTMELSVLLDDLFILDEGVV